MATAGCHRRGNDRAATAACAELPKAWPGLHTAGQSCSRPRICSPAPPHCPRGRAQPSCPTLPSWEKGRPGWLQGTPRAAATCRAGSSHRPTRPSTAERSLCRALRLHRHTQQLLMHPTSTNVCNCFVNRGLWGPAPPCGAEFHSVIKHCMKKKNPFLHLCFKPVAQLFHLMSPIYEK